MPNWCENKIEIFDNNNETFRAAIQAIFDDKERESGILNFFRPQPDDLFQGPVGLDSPTHNWYSWNCENWGTKWDMQLYEVEMLEDSIIIRGDTAWGPPLTAIEYLHEQTGYEITMGYCEQGMDFIGLSLNGDEYYSDEWSNYEWEAEWCEFMGYDLEQSRQDKMEEMFDELRDYLDFDQLRAIWQEYV